MIPCVGRIFWWDIFATAHCARPAGHMGAHADGVRWFNDDGFMVDGTEHDYRPCPLQPPPGRMLTLRQIGDIRGRYADGQTIAQIAAATLLPRQTVYQVAHRRTYKDVA